MSNFFTSCKLLWDGIMGIAPEIILTCIVDVDSIKKKVLLALVHTGACIASLLGQVWLYIGLPSMCGCVVGMEHAFEEETYSDYVEEEDTECSAEGSENGEDDSNSSEEDADYTDASEEDNGLHEKPCAEDNSIHERVAHVDESNEVAVDDEEDMGNIEFKTLTLNDLMSFHFPNLEVAFIFYRWFARFKGFAARKDRTVKNKQKEVIQQTFVCYRESGKTRKHSVLKRPPRKSIRCGCQANCQVGITTPHIYGSFASDMGGFENIGFRKKDKYNEIERQRRKKGLDARSAVAYLQQLRRSDDAMYWRHTTDNEGRLKNLFWCDGHCQKDYLLFGDVLAFDATYKKNKYSCPMVVFFGVNHHNQTIVFGTAVVSNETEETYVWVMEQLLHAMKGKMPISFITDGDHAMRNAIRRVFPMAHHRLCAWHLIRNATTNVKNPRFTSLFEDCMLRDHEISEFESKWGDMVNACGVQDNMWVRQLYEKKMMWATSYIRGNFFAGFRTTSRVDGLHALLGKFVNSRHNLTEFLEHHQRCLLQMRFREVESDFDSIHGEQELQTQLRSLEMAAAKVYTKEILFMFRQVVQSASRVRVTGEKRIGSGFIYFVSKYRRADKEWHVTFWPSNIEFKCSCQRMESLGIPCDHIVGVMDFLNMVGIPQSLILNRWTICAKESLDQGASGGWDPLMVCRYDALRMSSKRLMKVACRTSKDFSEVMTIFKNESETWEANQRRPSCNVRNEEDVITENIRNPTVVRTKGCRGGSSIGNCPGMRTLHCSACGLVGHNKQTCLRRRTVDEEGMAIGGAAIDW
ncbi:Zinc finger, PMZ-type [Sesbania bispinosa]|nr:Zinc finger, PMZ-type [Sesbania bispinosa]